MKVLNLLATGEIGGIEILCKDIAEKSTFDNTFAFLFDEGVIYENLKNKHHKVISLKKYKRKKIYIVNELEKYIKKENIDIITVHHGGRSCNQIYLMLKEKFPNLKFVRYLHASYDKYSFGNSWNLIKNILIKRTMQKTLMKSDLLIFISNAVKNSFEKKFDIGNLEKKVIYNGIGEKFYINNIKKVISDKKNIIYVGRLEKVKGVDILIKAFNLIIKENNKVKLTIVGDGSQNEKLKKLAIKLKCNSNMKFVGRQKEVIPFLDSSDIFVYPSIWEEGFGISIVEAMSRGCIPIVFKKGGLPEIIENGKNGFIVDDVNEIKLKECIVNVIKINDLEQLKRQAIKDSKKYDINITINELYSVYKKLIGDRNDYK